MMGDKITAKETMINLGVPCVPGSPGGVPTLEEAHKVSDEMGFPVIVKATAGGGGRGMKLALTKKDLDEAFGSARSESKAAFGNDEVYIENSEAVANIGYSGAGTIEFLYEDGEFYFIEMNTRLQVEHPVTETIFRVDLVKEQLRVASGEKMTFKQDDLEIKGHSIEVRINAERLPNFTPCPGTVSTFHAPGGLGYHNTFVQRIVRRKRHSKR